MKKAFLSFILAGALALTACGRAVPDDKPTEIHVISKNHDYYENGVVIGDKLSEFLDFETMVKAPLCASPNCTHTTYACLAKNVSIMPVFYNKYIYYFESNEGKVRETPEVKEFYIESRMKKASLASSEIQNVCEFDDCVPDDWNSAFILIGNTLWFIGDDKNPRDTEYSKELHYMPHQILPVRILCAVSTSIQASIPITDRYARSTGSPIIGSRAIWLRSKVSITESFR